MMAAKFQGWLRDYPSRSETTEALRGISRGVVCHYWFELLDSMTKSLEELRNSGVARPENGEQKAAGYEPSRV